MTAELGTGLQVTSHRRPYASAQDIESSVVCALGSGVRLLGYYMYHGGINPEGQYTTLNEEQRIGGYTTLPIKSYDFEAPINECGRVNDSFGAIRKWNLFVQDFEEELAGMEVILPEELPWGADDMETLRAAVRFDSEKGVGYLFINNHQRNCSMREHNKAAVRICWREQDYVLSLGDVQKDYVYVYRFQLGQNGEVLEITPGSVLCRFGKRIAVYLDKTDLTEAEPEVTETHIFFNRRAADRVYRCSDGLYVTQFKDSIILEKDGCKELITSAEKERVVILREDGSRSVRTFCIDKIFAKAEYKELVKAVDPEGEILYKEYKIYIDPLCGKEKIHNFYLHVDYVGDRAELYEDGKLLDDWYTTGADWNINIRRFGYPTELILRIYDSSNTIPCTFGKGVYYDLPVQSGCILRELSIRPEYHVKFNQVKECFCLKK